MPENVSLTRYSCALVTGASAGIGAEFARQLAPHCAVLVLVARRSERLVELAGELEKAHPGLRVMPLEADLTDPSARLQAVGHLLSKGLVPDLLVNNAGLGDYGEFATSDWMKVEAMLRLVGTEAAWGQVVNIGNDAEETRIGDLARLVLEVAGFDPTIDHVPAPVNSVARRCPDLTRLRRLTGYQPKIGLSAGVRDTFDWYRRAEGEGRR